MKPSLFVCATLVSLALPAWANAQGTSTSSTVVVQHEDDDTAINPAEPDFTLISLPTSLRLPRFGSAFRVTHRFARPLDGAFGQLAGDLFGLDSGAQIGLEYRFGIVRNGEVVIHRTSDKTLELSGQYGLIRQSPHRPVDLTVLATVEGANNFRERYAPAVGAIVSRRVSGRAALYVEPIFVHHADLDPAATGEQGDTFMIGVGGRVRVRPTVSIVAEMSPRTSGTRAGVNHVGVAVEKHVGGHVFQLNISDSAATTLGQIARGGQAGRKWFLGFNISRKFF